ncbi:MAG TPA: feruloyl-CoA synthase [Thermoanaerobaculia bacterium]|jgi:feruloyl-CoA synthase|nr:feruloyl-CoA synthase [Thermoanaerobaculia bacterium]
MTRSPRFARPTIEVERRPDGVLILWPREALADHPAHLGLLLRDWAEREPGRVFLAERQGDGVRRITYGEAWRMARSLATRMLEDGLGPGRPVMVLSDNSVDHALIGLGAMVAGIPVAPVSAAYSLLSQDHAKLRTMHAMLEPGWIFTENGAGYLKALGELPIDPGTRVVLNSKLAEVLGSVADESLVDQVFDRIGPDTVAKILFTSGSTGTPKGVINTHRMLCSNQQAMTQGWPFLRERQQVVVDWLPWSHTFGGNHNFNLVLWHGGTLWVDRGKPAPGRIEETVATLRLASPTVYFNVPRGFDALLPFFESDEALARGFFQDLDLLFYAAAALPRPTWDRLVRVALRVRETPVPFVSAWGATETSPLVTQVLRPLDEPGNIGVPVPGASLKLVPNGLKLEIRVKGPQLTPGYFKDPQRFQSCLDEEGFYSVGDAVKLADADDPNQGLVFDGRLSEDFKLTSGTWVHVGALRVSLIAALSPLVQDAVIAGHDREAVGVLLFPDAAACAKAAGAPADLPRSELFRDERLRSRIADALRAYNHEQGEASSRAVVSAVLLAEPPSIDAGEITDKGYINQRAVLDCRAALVEALFASDSPDAIRVR